jgi:hypothetical protein
MTDDPKPFISETVSATRSSRDEHDAVSSAVLSALKCVDGFDDDDDEKAKATSKVKGAAPFVVSEAKEDIETGVRSSKEVSSGSPNTKARKQTNVDSFKRKFDGDEQPSASAMEAATASLALQAPVPARHGDDEGDVQPSAGPRTVAASTVGTRSREL